MDKEEFDMEDFDITFNSHNPPITIPDEVSDVVDNDFDLPYSPPEVGGDWAHQSGWSHQGLFKV